MSDLAPYRLEWRPNLTTRWSYIEALKEHPGDLETYIKKSRLSSILIGNWRLISQHVIETVTIKERKS